MSQTENRIATVKPVEEREATGRVAAVFADIKATKNLDFVPAFWRVLAINPAQLELVWTTLKSLMHPEAVGRTPALDPRTREIIALAVSATNGCPYCINSHTAALRKLGMDDEALGEVMAIVGLFSRDLHHPAGARLSRPGGPGRQGRGGPARADRDAGYRRVRYAGRTAGSASRDPASRSSSSPRTVSSRISV
jgi:AhpD family alkylhydroperoxidase